MAFTSFIPTIFNAELMVAFRETVVAANLCGRDYEGNAASGNKVTVNTASAIAVKDYKANLRQTTPDAIATTSQDLLIDQEKNYDFLVDDIDRRQAAGTLEPFTLSAAQGLAEDTDKFLLALASGASTHQTASTITTGDGALDVIRNLRKALNKAFIPLSDRNLIINAEFEALLLSASSKLMNVDSSGSPAALRDASVGRLLGFNIYMSESLPISAKPQAVAWYKPALAFVDQITETEAMRDTAAFKDRLRGLHVYGGKAVRPAGFAAWTSI